jgi:ribonuclease BN (tRNA processing enzyme)
VSLPIVRQGGTPPSIRLYASPDSADAIRTSLDAADAKGQSFFGNRLAWVTPDFGKAIAVAKGVTLTTVPADHLPPGGGAAGCVIDIGGTRVVYSGDTRPCAAMIEASRDAELLVHEVGGLESQADAVHLPGHSTAADVGRVAAEAGVRAVALVHIPPSYAVASPDLVAETRRFADRADVFMTEDGLIRSL